MQESQFKMGIVVEENNAYAIRLDCLSRILFSGDLLVMVQTEIYFIKSDPNSQHRPICLICNPLL